MYQCAKQFFLEYMKNFDLTENQDYESSYYYKYRHTLDVVAWMEKIIKALDFNEREKNMALTTAIFHDLGRFVQLEKYKAYNDLKTNFDHALESVNLLIENDWFEKSNISKEDQNLIIFAIANHNKKEIEKCDGFQKVLANLLRDADKLAVLQRSPFHAREYKQNDLPALSDLIYHNFLEQKLLNYSDVQNVTDQLVALMAFIFDLNYSVSKKYVFSEQLLNDWLDFISPAMEKNQLKEMINAIHDFQAKIED